MNRPVPTFRKIMTSLAALGVAATVAGCGRTLLFASHDGVNFKIVANTSSSPPLEANFGLNRTVATVVPGNKTTRNGEADGNAVNMLAAFDVDYNPDAQKALGGTLVIDNQFASGVAAKNVAETNPEAAAQIARIGTITESTFGEDANSALLKAFLFKPGTTTADPDRRTQMLAAMRSVGAKTTRLTILISGGDKYAADRDAVAKALKLKQ